MLEYENELHKKNIYLIAGIDEVGRGPLYGPVVAACVVMKPDFFLEEINDSKKLSEKKREKLNKIIRENAISIGIGEVSSKRIDEINILEATKEAMKIAIEECLKNTNIEHILIDAVKLDTNIPSTSIIKGDSKSFSIACASIIAKVYRDNLLKQDALKYPLYSFDKHKGYGTKKHIEAIKEFGVLESHRRSFKPVSDALKNSNK